MATIREAINPTQIPPDLSAAIENYKKCPVDEACLSFNSIVNMWLCGPKPKNESLVTIELFDGVKLRMLTNSNTQNNKAIITTHIQAIKVLLLLPPQQDSGIDVDDPELTAIQKTFCPLSVPPPVVDESSITTKTSVEDEAHDFIQVTSKQSVLDKQKTLFFHSLDTCLSNYVTFTSLDTELQTNRDFVLKVIRKNPLVFNLLSEEFKNNEEIALAAVLQSPHSLEYIGETLRNNAAFILKVTQDDGFAVLYASDRLKKDLAFALDVLKQSGLALKYLDKTLQDMDTVVAAAIKQNRGVLKYASSRLQKNRMLINLSLKPIDKKR